MTVQYINISSLSEKLAGRSVRSIQRDIKSGSLPKPYRVNGRLLFIESEVDAHIWKQSSKSTPSQETGMNKFEKVLVNARVEAQAIGEVFKATQNELNALKTKLRTAPQVNSELIDAKADAIVEGKPEPEGELIDVKVLQQDIQIKEVAMSKLKQRSEDARLAMQDARSVMSTHRKRDARKAMTGMGFDIERGKFRMDKLAKLDGSGLIDLLTLAQIAWGNGFTLGELFSEKLIPAGAETKAASKRRVDELLG
jgi:predicted DNA-binding transcriptional regulator AlpA